MWVSFATAELSYQMELPEGARALVTLLAGNEDESRFWIQASQTSVDKVWENTEEAFSPSMNQ
ncbi:MAG: hypothetical protein ACUVR3_10685 [Candidatus Roseilinea sp.]|uniref:hypothetical protein n=1 Tax=Candidatus Roseilinea sp. TaxID=2838777 RepID=UPI0040495D28